MKKINKKIIKKNYGTAGLPQARFPPGRGGEGERQPAVRHHRPHPRHSEGDRRLGWCPAPGKPYFSPIEFIFYFIFYF